MRIRPEVVSRDAMTCKTSSLSIRIYGRASVFNDPEIQNFICSLHFNESITDRISSLKAFPETLTESWEAEQLEHLLSVTHAIGEYRLVFKQGEPFKPVTLRVHGDPISIIGKVLDQNRRSYTKINDFVRIGKGMVMAGLTFRTIKGQTTIAQMTEEQIQEQEAVAEKRVVSM